MAWVTSEGEEEKRVIKYVFGIQKLVKHYSTVENVFKVSEVPFHDGWQSISLSDTVQCLIMEESAWR